MSVWLQGYTSSTNYSKYGLAKAEREIEPASFTIHITGSPRNIHACFFLLLINDILLSFLIVSPIKYDIIMTDYIRYSLIYSCDYVPGLDINFQHIWILS